MPLILSHGQPKTGSSFLFQSVALAVEAQNGLRMKLFRDQFLPEEFLKSAFPDALRDNFVSNIADDQLAGLLEVMPADRYYVLKTHGNLSDLARRKIESGEVVAFTSLRDPRDIAISMLDAGVRDRGKEKNTFFTTLITVEQTVPHVKFNTGQVLQWTSCPGIVAFPFYLTAKEQNFTITRLLEHVGLSQHTAKAIERFGRNKSETIWQYHKGIPDRFLTDLPAADVLYLTEQLSPEIKHIDSETMKWMSYHGYEALARELMHKREEALASLATATAV